MIEIQKVRFVFDTNLLLSAMMNESSVPSQALAAAQRSGHLIFTLETLLEAKEVFNRRKFDKYAPLEERSSFLAGVINAGETVEITETITACRDPKDDKFLTAAVSGKAGYIVTGDEHLLEMHPFREVEIITARALLDVLA